MPGAANWIQFNTQEEKTQINISKEFILKLSECITPLCSLASCKSWWKVGKNLILPIQSISVIHVSSQSCKKNPVVSLLRQTWPKSFFSLENWWKRNMALCHFFSLLLLLLAVVGDGYLIVCNLLWREFTLFPLLTSGWWVEGRALRLYCAHLWGPPSPS